MEEEEEEKGISFSPYLLSLGILCERIKIFVCIYLCTDLEYVCVNMGDKRDKTMNTGLSIVFLLLICGVIHFWKCLYLKSVICTETRVH